MSAIGLELLLSSICFNATFCGSFYENPIIDEQLSHRESRLLNLTKEINGKHLYIGTVNNYPLSWVERTKNGTLEGRGVAFVLVEILQKRFNFTYEIIVPETNWEGGNGNLDNTLLGLINSSKVDMGAAFLPILYSSQRVVTFSPGLDEGVWMMLLKRPTESAAGSGLLAPFENHVWYLILAAVISFGPCITFLTYLRKKLMPEEESQIKLSPSCWFVYGAFIKQGTTLSPEANTTRVLFATWWIFIILLSAFYTANLTAFLTLSKFTLDIELPQDLYKKNYKWVTKEGAAVQYVINDPNEDLHYLTNMVAKGRGEFKGTIDDREYLPLVSSGTVLIQDQTAVDHLMYGDYLQKARENIVENERCTYVVASYPFMTKMRGFAFPRNSTLSFLFNSVLTYLVQAGMIKYLVHRDLPSTKICPLDLQSKDRKLRNGDLLMTYMIMITGLAAAAAVFIVEILTKRYLTEKVMKISDKVKRKVAKVDAVPTVTKYDEGRPPPYESLFGKNSQYKSSDKNELRVINGREYWVVNTTNGDTRLIPLRTPSAFLYHRYK